MDTYSRDFDVIVVGSGPGGATVARDMARAGKKVLILERGSHVRLNGSFWHYLLYQCIPFKSMLFTSQLVAMVRGLLTGGSSVFYYGTCFPVPFEMLESYGVNIRDEVEELQSEIPIAPLSDDIMGPKATLVMKSARELGFDWKKLDKFMDQDKFDPNQDSAHFYYGDPRKVKWSARMFVEEAMAYGAKLINRAKVKKVVVENGKATGVVYSRWGRKRSVVAPKIVIAAGGIGSPMVLKKSGIPEAGRDFFFDPLISVVGYIDGIETKSEIPMSAGIHFSDKGYVMTDMAVPKMIDMAFTASAFRFHRLFSQKKAVRIMVKIKDDLGGRLSRWGGIRKRLTKADKEKLNSGYENAKAILKNAGAKEVYKTWKLAAHPGGTVKIGELVDHKLETRIENLYVCDCSVIPQAWGLPPTMTILGLARKLSNHLLDRRSKPSADEILLKNRYVRPSAREYSDVLTRLLSTREIRTFVSYLVPDILSVWAGNNAAKRALANPVGRIVSRGFAGDKALEGSQSLSDLFRQGRFVNRLAREIPGLVDGAMTLISESARHIESLDDDRQKALISGLFQSQSNEIAGDIVNSLCRILQSVHRQNPVFFSDHLGPWIRTLMETVDFGEVKDVVSGSRDDLIALVDSIMDTLLNYPSKLVVLVSLIPDAGDVVIRSARSFMAGLNQLSPDLLTDVVLSLIRDIDGVHVGNLINEAAEFIRKIHTGSALLGEPNNPRLPIDLRRLMDQVTASVDSKLAMASLSMFDDLAETVSKVLSDAVSNDPEIRRSMIQRKFASVNAKTRQLTRKAEAWEDMMDNGEFTDQMNRGLKDLDPGDLADAVNRIFVVINEARDEDPRVVKDVFSHFLNTLDTREIGKTAQWMSQDFWASAKPLAREIMTPFAKEMVASLKADMKPKNGNDVLEDVLSELSKNLWVEEALL